jgi:hypothetical protein
MLKAMDPSSVKLHAEGKIQCDESRKQISAQMDYNNFREFFLLLPDTALLFDYWMDSTCSKFRGCEFLLNESMIKTVYSKQSTQNSPLKTVFSDLKIHHREAVFCTQKSCFRFPQTLSRKVESDSVTFLLHLP